VALKDLLKFLALKMELEGEEGGAIIRPKAFAGAAK
jgi:hypothetical protein